MTHIYIPTRGRVGRQITLESISEAWLPRTILVCPRDEVREHWGRGRQAIGCPHGLTIGQKRQWIFENAPGPYAVMFDDDLRFARRRTDEPTKFEAVQDIPGAFDDMMDQIMHLLILHPLVGIRNRSGANRETEGVLLNRRQHDVLAVDLDVMKRKFFRLDRTTLMEDFDFVLQFLTAGYSNALVNSYTEDDMGGRAAPGGCADERGLEEQRCASEWLAQTWPDYVTVVQKETKGAGEWAVRTDVRVAWKKAAEAGKKR